MDLEQIDRIRQLTIIALVSDDDLMELLVLKGANALSLIYGLNLRSSIDLDFSLEGDFGGSDIDELRYKFEGLLKRTFQENGYQVFDVTLAPEPSTLSKDFEGFWGGYRLEFKVIRRSTFAELSGDIEALRRQAMVVDEQQRKRYRVDISKHEFCSPKNEAELEGYTLYVYTPTMMVCEKLRAICQQMQDYRDFMRSQSQSARPRDFFDIYHIVERLGVNVEDPRSIEILTAMFEAKRVPLELLGQIGDTREYHRAGFSALQLTVGPEVDLESLDFYFDYVLELIGRLKSFWKE